MRKALKDEFEKLNKEITHLNTRIDEINREKNDLTEIKRYMQGTYQKINELISTSHNVLKMTTHRILKITQLEDSVNQNLINLNSKQRVIETKVDDIKTSNSELDAKLVNTVTNISLLLEREREQKKEIKEKIPEPEAKEKKPRKKKNVYTDEITEMLKAENTHNKKIGYTPESIEAVRTALNDAHVITITTQELNNLLKSALSKYNKKSENNDFKRYFIKKGMLRKEKGLNYTIIPDDRIFKMGIVPENFDRDVYVRALTSGESEESARNKATIKKEGQIELPKEIHIKKLRKAKKTNLKNSITEEVNEHYNNTTWKQEAIRDISVELNSNYKSSYSTPEIKNLIQSALEKQKISKWHYPAYLMYFNKTSQLIAERNGKTFNYRINRDHTIPTKKPERGILDELGMSNNDDDGGKKDDETKMQA